MRVQKKYDGELFCYLWEDAAGSHFGSVCVIKNGLNLGKTVFQ